MPNKITLELKARDVEELVGKLSIQDKIRLIRKLENETWARRLDEVASRIKKRFKQTAVTDKEIRQICEETRQRLYNERRKKSSN